MTNPFIQDLSTWQEHEHRALNLTVMANEAHFKNEQVSQMREASLHHLAKSCDNMDEKWTKTA